MDIYLYPLNLNFDYFGLLIIILIAKSLFREILFYILECIEFNNLNGGPDDWAIVTGATDGIGLEFAKQLFQNGFNVLLISRNENKLMDTKKDIIRNSGSNRKIDVLCIDFKDPSRTIYSLIEDELYRIKEVHILVNNVGICYPGARPAEFTKISKSYHFVKDMINVNMISCTAMTKIMMQKFQNNNQTIIFISSMGSLYPSPFLSFYSSTKTYSDVFSRVLQEEYRFDNIFIQLLRPGYVSTNMSNNKKPSAYAPTAKVFAKTALKTIHFSKITSVMSAHKLWRFLNYMENLLTFLFGYDFCASNSYHYMYKVKKRIDLKFQNES